MITVNFSPFSFMYTHTQYDWYTLQYFEMEPMCTYRLDNYLLTWCLSNARNWIEHHIYCYQQINRHYIFAMRSSNGTRPSIEKWCIRVLPFDSFDSCHSIIASWLIVWVAYICIHHVLCLSFFCFMINFMYFFTSNETFSTIAYDRRFNIISLKKYLSSFLHSKNLMVIFTWTVFFLWPIPRYLVYSCLIQILLVHKLQ